MTPKKALVSGGTGFIGRRLAQRLLDSGVAVVILTRQTRVAEPLAGASYVVFDFERGDAVAANCVELGGIDTFFHLSSAINPSSELSPRGLSLLQREVTNPLRFLDTVGYSLRKVVFASSILVYPLVARQLLEEDRDENPPHFYGAHKLALETLGLCWARQTGRLFVSARIGQAYGPRMRVNRILPDTILKAKNGEKVVVFGDGSVCLDWIHVDDVVDGLLCCAEHGESGAFNIGTGIGTTNLELVERVIGTVGSASAVEFDPQRRAEQHQVMSPERARRTIGFVARHSFADGLRAMLADP